MKRVVLWSSLTIVLFLGIAIAIALNFGETSPVIASGKVNLPGELTKPATGIRTVFVTVFDANSPMPMPYGAMRERLNEDANGEFLEFFITKERLQVMNPALPLPKKLRIKVRLDRDGMGGMDQPGDLVGSADQIQLGQTGVSITINKKI